jgi:hypothetical protein
MVLDRVVLSRSSALVITFAEALALLQGLLDETFPEDSHKFFIGGPLRVSESKYILEAVFDFRGRPLEQLLEHRLAVAFL